MKDLLTDKELEHWPISSVAHYARRNGLMYASNSTWYKYARILGLRKKAKQFRHKRKKKKGIKAAAPNSIWHADVTYFRVGNEMHYIYLVVDNYSRKILSHLVSNRLNLATYDEQISDYPFFRIFQFQFHQAHQFSLGHVYIVDFFHQSWKSLERKSFINSIVKTPI